MPRHGMACLLAVAVTLFLSGCASVKTVEHAKGHCYKKEDGEIVWDKEPKPGYYAFLPLAIPFDIATFPVQMLRIPFWAAENP